MLQSTWIAWVPFLRRKSPSLPTARIDSPFWIGLSLYVALLIGLRVIISPSMEPDEADLALFSQSLAWGYSEQPPLFFWMVWAVVQVVGLNIFAIALVKMLVLGALVVAVRALAKVSFTDQRLVMPMIMSIVLQPTLSWHAVSYLSHSLLLCVACVATLHRVIQVRLRRTTFDYAMLGAMLALGLYAKYTFLFFVAGIVLASLTIKAYREAMFDRRLFISILIPVVTVFPHAVWVLNHWEVVWGNIAFKAGVHQPRSLMHIPMGVLNFLQNSFFMLVLFFLVVFGVFRPKWQSISGNELLRFIERFFIAIGLLFAAQIVLGGTHRFHERWLQPFALVVPLWVFLRLESLELSAERLRRFVMCGVIVLVGITGARASQIWLGGSDGGRNLLQMNYIPLTEELAKLDAANATLLAGDRVLAGHLALHFPKATVISLERRGYQPTIDPTRPIIAVWHHELGVENSLFMGLWLKELFGDFRFAGDIGHAKVPPLLKRRVTNDFAFVKVVVP